LRIFVKQKRREHSQPAILTAMLMPMCRNFCFDTEQTKKYRFYAKRQASHIMNLPDFLRWDG